MTGSNPHDRYVWKPEDIIWEEDEYPDCAKYRDQLGRIREIITADRAQDDLHRYITTYRGGRFDPKVDRAHPNEFTDKDFRAIWHLSVYFLHSAQLWLRGEGLETVRALLGSIPDDRDIWEVPPQEYAAMLGPDSKASKLWKTLVARQDGARHAGKYVTAGKAMHGKRPRLIPIYDREGIGRAIPGITQRNIWEVMWCALRDKEIRERLLQIKAGVPVAADLSLLRVLDIVIWMSR